MTKDEKIKNILERIEIASGILSKHTASIDALEAELKDLKLEKWSPPSGSFIVDHTGAVVDITKQNPGIVNQEFGNMRVSQNTASKLATNMKLFNRLSAYIGDINPVIEYGSVGNCSTISLVFYDWSGKFSDQLRKDIDNSIFDIKG